MASQEYVTRPTLLLRVRDHEDQESWAEFVEIYGPLIHRFALSRGVHRDNASDITQDVMRNVAKAMHSFEYDPSRGTFRSWLFTIIRREIYRSAEKAKRKPGVANFEDTSELLDKLPDAQEAKDWDADYQLRLVQWAMGKIRHEFSDNVWAAYVATAINGQSPQETAAQLEMSKGSVYVAKSRVLKRLIEKIRSVDEEEWELDAIRKDSHKGESSGSDRTT